MPIQFFQEDVEFLPEKQEQIKSWIRNVSESFDCQLVDLNYIFCSDDYLLSINKEHLKRDYYTDIITFDISDKNQEIEGDIFISIDRIQENATLIGTSFEGELYRVMIHGVLHLVGFDDQTESDKKLMREKEEACLSLLKS